MVLPTPTVSVVDLVMEVEKNIEVEAVDDVFKMLLLINGILNCSEKPLGSTDYSPM